MKAQMYNRSWWEYETNTVVLENKYRKLLTESGFTIIKFIEHHFEPYGWTCLFLLGESHLAIHTFPEESKTYVELSSCVEKYFNTFIKKEHLDMR